MSKDGKWWDKSITLVEGCTPISDGCKNCWSAGIAHRFHGKKGLTTDGHFNGKIICRGDRLEELMCKKPTRWTIWNDLFHPQVPFEFIHKVFIVMALRPQHKFLVLTKRIERPAKYVQWKTELATRNWVNVPWPLPNVHLGVTVCNNVEKWKINVLRTIPAAHRFVCLEPLLSKIQLYPDCLPIYKHIGGPCCIGKPGYHRTAYSCDIDWLILGCESLGYRAGRFQDGYAEAALDIIEQCKAAGVPVWHKQYPLNGRASKDMDEWPAEFQVQELI